MSTPSLAEKSRFWQFLALVAIMAVCGTNLYGQITVPDVCINEFMASNDDTIVDEDGDSSDWIELRNFSGSNQDIGGWYLTDDAQDLDKWQIPLGTVLEPGDYLLIFASGKDRTAPLPAELHTNFKLSASGEYLALVQADGITVMHEYSPDYPAQMEDISYGLGTEGSEETLLGATSEAEALVPDNSYDFANWLNDTSSWPISGDLGVGYDRATTYVPYFSEDMNVYDDMYGINQTILIKADFNVQNATAVSDLVLRMRYDDGFVAYINGTEVARSSNVPSGLDWDSGATATNSDSSAVLWEDFSVDISDANLVSGNNVLAIHGLNRGDSSSDFLIQPMLVATIASSTAVDYRYFETPTPGAANASGTLGYMAPVEADMPHGYYDEPITVNLFCDTEDAEIRYTTDCSQPTESSLLYNPASPLQITGSTVIRAAAFKTGYKIIPSVTFSYIYLPDVLTQSSASALAMGFPSQWIAGASSSGVYDSKYRTGDYEMDPMVVNSVEYAPDMIKALTDLPVFSVVADMDDMFDQYTGIYPNSIMRASTDPLWEKAASLELFNADDDFTVNAGVRISGEAARWAALNDKQSFRFVFRGEYGSSKLRTDFFDDPEVDEYDTILMRGHWGHSFVSSEVNSVETGATWADANPNTATYIRDIYGHDTYRAVSGLSSRGRFAHVFLNGIYWGMYEVVERPDNSFNAEHRGGSKDDYDVLKGALGQVGINGLLQDGQRDAYNKLMSFFNASASSGSNYTSVTPTTDAVLAQVEQYLDVDAYIDYMISLWYISRLDFPRKNWYVAGRRDDNDPDGPPLERFRFYTWDSEASLWSVDAATQSDRWLGTDTSNDTGPVRIFRRIRHSPQFQRRWADRVQELFMYEDSVMSPQNCAQRFINRRDELLYGIICESARWGDNPELHVDDPTTKAHWLIECDRLINEYFPDRWIYMLEQMTEAGLWPGFLAPEYNQQGGVVDDTFELIITNPNEDGDIYYTLDGSDPRDGGGTLYSGPIDLSSFSFVEVNACVRIGTDYSARNHASFITFGDGGLVVSEVMYNPPSGSVTGGSYNSDDYEFIELWNTTSKTLDLSGMQIAGDVQYTFPQSTYIGPDQRLLVIASANAMVERYGLGALSIHEYTGMLGNGDGVVSLLGTDGTPIIQFEYEDGGAWPGRADGTGSSLELKDPMLNYGDPDSWRNSAEYLGSPGWAGEGSRGDIIVNEVLTHTDLPEVDFIEFYNTTGQSINISGWYISDSASDLKKYQIPFGTIPAHGYIVFDEDDFNADGLGFGLSSAHGDDVWLTEADGTGKLTRFVVHAEFDAALNGESLGCWPNADGNRLSPMQTPTPGYANSGPRFGPVIISEIAYNLGEYDHDDYEFVEIYNSSDDDVELVNWEIDGGVDYTFPVGSVLEAGEVAVILSFNPDNPLNAARISDFRAFYGLSSSVALYGGYGGKLDNSGERISLYRPDEPPMEEPYFIPLIEEDTVEYEVLTPWPVTPDGQGDSLTRVIPAGWGDTASSWSGEEPTPGEIGETVIPGDANHDGKVDIFDFLILKGNYGTPQDATWEMGDFDGNGAVDIFDFLILKDHYGEGT